MRLITHRSHLDALPASDIKAHIQRHFDQLSEDTDVPPTILVLFPDTDFQGPELNFLGESGIYSDLFGKSRPGEQSACKNMEVPLNNNHKRQDYLIDWQENF
jgi:hypothetical protein